MFDLFDISILRELPSNVREWVFRTLLAILIFGIVLLLRRVLTWLFVAPFRAISQRTENDIDNTMLDIVEPASGYVVVAIALLLSTQILSVENVELVFIQRLARSLIIVGVAVALFQATDLIQPNSRLVTMTGLTLDKELMPFVRTGLKIIIIAMTLVIIIQEWGYNVSGLVAGLGLGGLAFSLAAQDTVSNLFGFSTIVTDRPFVVGEYIVTPDVEGIVERVGVRSTKIRTLDQSLIIVPNNTLANSVVTNWSRLSYRRYNFTIGITYDATSQQMRDLLTRIRGMLESRATVQQDSIVVRFTEFASSSLDILVRCNVNISDWGEWVGEREEINLAIMDIVADMGLSMAFPSRSLYIESMPDGAGDDDAPQHSTPTPRRQPAPAPSHQLDAAPQQDEADESPASGI